MKLSRHAKNNMRLCKITEKDILKIIESPDTTAREGDKLAPLKKFPPKYTQFPLKVVYKKSKGETTILLLPTR